MKKKTKRKPKAPKVDTAAIGLGDKVVCLYTGYTGYCIGKAQYLYGCSQVLISADKLDKDGKMLDALWLDEQRVEVTERHKPRRARRAGMDEIPGGPQDAPTGSRY